MINESLSEYAQRISKNIRNPVLIGVSFGEILVAGNGKVY
jgi:hypothetical protein